MQPSRRRAARFLAVGVGEDVGISAGEGVGLGVGVGVGVGEGGGGGGGEGGLLGARVKASVRASARGWAGARVKVWLGTRARVRARACPSHAGAPDRLLRCLSQKPNHNAMSYSYLFKCALPTNSAAQTPPSPGLHSGGGTTSARSQGALPVCREPAWPCRCR